MEKDRTYYQQLAENYYLRHFAEIKEKRDKENAEAEARMKEMQVESGIDDYVYVERYYTRVNVNTKDETCFFPNPHSNAVRPQELLFCCQIKDGELLTLYMKDGKDNVAEALGLVDLHDVNERIEVDYVRKEDGFLHLYLPKELQGYSKDFYKVKLYYLDGFVTECNYTGWGDCMTRNVLEAIAALLNEDCVNCGTNELRDLLNCYVGPGEDEESYFAEFEFSHCELVKDNKDQEFGWAVFICYRFKSLELY